MELKALLPTDDVDEADLDPIQVLGPVHDAELETRQVAGPVEDSELERLASSSGQAIGMGFPYPITIKRLVDWAGKLKDRGFTLTPLSALATRAGP